MKNLWNNDNSSSDNEKNLPKEYENKSPGYESK